MSVPPKSSPLQFNLPFVNQAGFVQPQWQQILSSLQQRIEGPVSSVAPATSVAATAGIANIPYSMQTDGSFLYINIGNGTWKRIALVAF